MSTTYHISPIGPFLHPWVNKADTKFNADGLYHVDLILEGSKAEDLKAKIRGASEEYRNTYVEDQEMKPGEAKKWTTYFPFEDEEDPETGEPTGRTIFHFKQNAKIKLKDGSTKEVEIELRDAKDNVIETSVFNEDEGRILFSTRGITMVSTKQAGVRLDFYKVQVTKKNKRSGGGSKGFGAVEGGYEADASDQSFGDSPEGEEEGQY